MNRMHRSTTYPTPCADMLAGRPVVDLAKWRAVRLTERALAGDVDATIEWLEKYDQPSEARKRGTRRRRRAR